MIARITILLVLAFAATASAQRVEQVVGAEGEVHDLARHGDQVLLGTSGGLLVLRGNSVVRRLGVAEGLPGQRVRSVSVVGDRVFIGTVEGLAELDETLAPVATHAIPRVRRVVAFAGHRWVAGYAGLHRLDGHGPTAVSLGRSHARRRINDLLVVGDELWVATAGAGVIRVRPDGTAIGRVHGRSLPHDLVWDLEHHGDQVLVATLDGLAVLDARGRPVAAARATVTAAARLPIRDLRQVLVHDDRIHVVSFGGGLSSLARAGRARPRRALAALSTPSGILVGHAEGLDRGEHPVLGAGLPSADVTALARAFGKLWVGTFDRGLATLGPQGRVHAETRAHDRWSVDRRINDLAVTGRGARQRLWIATDRGLYWHDGRRFVRAEGEHTPGSTHVTSLHVDPRGALWVTSSRVLARWRGDDRWRSWDSDSGFPVAQLHAVTTRLRSGALEVWVGSLHGLYRFDPRTGRAEPHTVATGDLPVDWVTGLVSFGGAIVAGTYHGGLAWGRPGGFTIEREGPTLPAGWVNPHAMRVVGDDLWIGTLERGLLVGRHGAWRHLTTHDGLPSDDVTAVLADGDHVWVATRGGLARLRSSR